MHLNMENDVDQLTSQEKRIIVSSAVRYVAQSLRSLQLFTFPAKESMIPAEPKAIPHKNFLKMQLLFINLMWVFQVFRFFCPINLMWVFQIFRFFLYKSSVGTN